MNADSPSQDLFGLQRHAVSRAEEGLSAQDAFIGVVELATRLPGVEVSTAQGTPALTLDGRLLARLRSEAEGWLVTRCDLAERERLLEQAPEVFHLHEAYVNYPMILINLARVERDTLARLLEQAWRHLASPARLQAYKHVATP
jgi:hypothetical protein